MRPRLHADHEVAVELAVDLANEGRAAGRRRRGIADLDAKLRANEDADVASFFASSSRKARMATSRIMESLPYERTSLKDRHPGW